MARNRLLSAAAVLVCAGALSACGSNANSSGDEGGLLSGLTGRLGSGESGVGPEAGIGVNSFLWRATLDTLSFMPLEQVDPFGGVIITDWYANPEQPNERFKATAYILDTRLRADALSVQLFKQVRGAEDGEWADASVDPATRIQIENAILTRARQYRIAQVED
ncbi:DUF3576 domain-containing protein [Marinicauda salina]|uniref:DUF3576 domain-containing protein n=1 Tax=Marinicauda salina TaxID=2135793 RepID=A0A2U2BWF0_9PROT|nr:DUF3576 domain-containing protein [Marinicauda salina]PWE18345.1 DUF3576 domain-containing protein [Marinicauda salina]